MPVGGDVVAVLGQLLRARFCSTAVRVLGTDEAQPHRRSGAQPMGGPNGSGRWRIGRGVHQRPSTALGPIAANRVITSSLDRCERSRTCTSLSPSTQWCAPICLLSGRPRRSWWRNSRTEAENLIHGWDVAPTTGGDKTLDPELMAAGAAFFDQAEDVHRQAGFIAPRTPVPDGTDPADDAADPLGSGSVMAPGRGRTSAGGVDTIVVGAGSAAAFWPPASARTRGERSCCGRPDRTTRPAGRCLPRSPTAPPSPRPTTGGHTTNRNREATSRVSTAARGQGTSGSA